MMSILNHQDFLGRNTLHRNKGQLTNLFFVYLCFVTRNYETLNGTIHSCIQTGKKVLIVVILIIRPYNYTSYQSKSLFLIPCKVTNTCRRCVVVVASSSSSSSQYNHGQFWPFWLVLKCSEENSRSQVFLWSLQCWDAILLHQVGCSTTWSQSAAHSFSWLQVAAVCVL